MHGPTQAIEYLDVNWSVRVWSGIRRERIDSYRAGGRSDAGVSSDAVAHGGGRVVVDRAEVALAVDELVAHRELLRHAHERVVDSRVAVRVIVAHHLADDLGALRIRAGRAEPELVHGVEHTAMHGLQAVAHV